MYELTNKIVEIYYWISTTRYKDGATSKEIIHKFGEEYKKAWERLKRQSRNKEGIMYFEDGVWRSWNKLNCA